jgi:uncharacterized membrane protein
MLFFILKWVHVLAAIVALGANITYSIWLARAQRQPDVLPFTLHTVRLIDRRLANPGYGVLLLTGLAMAYALPLPLTTPWLLTAIILYVTVAVVGFAVYAPVVRRQVQSLESEGITSPSHQAATRQANVLGLVTTLVVVAIVFLVVKPGLWA